MTTIHTTRRTRMTAALRRCAVPLLLGTAVLTYGPATTAHAEQYGPCNGLRARQSFTVQVPANQPNVHIVTLAPGQAVGFSAYGQVWSGVWFTGTNGPEGVAGPTPRSFPSPWSNRYGLVHVSKTTSPTTGVTTTSAYSPLPQASRTMRCSAPVRGRTTIAAQVNDDVLWDNTEAFFVQVVIYG